MFYTQISLLMSAFALLMCVTQLSLYRITHTKRSTTIMLYTQYICVNAHICCTHIRNFGGAFWPG